MHNYFDAAAKEILNLSDRAIIPFLNANFAASIPPNVPVFRTNTELRIPSSEKDFRTIIADAVFLIADTCYHIEVQLDRRTGMALRMFLYGLAQALDDPGEEDGVPLIDLPKSLVIYLEPPAAAPDHELLRIRFPDGSRHEYRAPVINLPELSVSELAERHLLIFAPLYTLKLRKKMKQAGTKEERAGLAAELKKVYEELREGLKRERDLGNLTELDEDKIREIAEILHRKVYGGYNEFEEDDMDASNLFSELRVIEKLHQELDEERRAREELEQFREEAISKVAELEQFREEAISMAELDRQRLREDTARNILRLGLSVEQAAQATGLPPETVRTLASRP
jgi:hypothetical protein